MAVTYGEIKRWKESDALALVDAMTSRLRGLEYLEDDLRQAGKWEHAWSCSQGEVAARTFISRLGDTITDLAAEAAAIRTVADRLANGLSVLHQEVLNVEAFASRHQFAISEEGALTDLAAGQPFSPDEDDLRTRAEHDLRQTVAEIIDKGRAVERQAAEGLASVNSGSVSDGGATSVLAATLSQMQAPAPPAGDASAAEVTMWWESLSQLDKDQAIAHHGNSIRNLWGIPTTVRDELNTAVLIRDIESTQQQLTVLEDAPLSSGWIGRSHRINQLEDRLYTLNEIHKKLVAVPDSYLLQLDMDSQAVPEVTYSVGNPDLADNVVLTVPGYTTNPKDSFGGMADEALFLQRDAVLLSPHGATTAAIAFMGYQAPQQEDLVGVATRADAYAGAEKVTNALRGVEATNGNTDLNLSLFGHSYGSTTSGIAAQQLALDGPTPIDNLALYGSPGFPDIDNTPSTEPFGIARDRTFYMDAKGDRVVDFVDGIRPTGLGLGPSPGLWGMQELSTRSHETALGMRYDTDGYNAFMEQRDGRDPDVGSHSIYAKENTTSAYNLAAIATGNSDMAFAVR